MNQHLCRFRSRQAPLVVVSESMQRLNQIMAGSKLELLDSDARVEGQVTGIPMDPHNRSCLL